MCPDLGCCVRTKPVNYTSSENEGMECPSDGHSPLANNILTV